MNKLKNIQPYKSKMNARHPAIADFFISYEREFNNALQGRPAAEIVVNAFADCFIAANPFGVACGKNDDQFPKIISQGYEFYKSIGMEAMKIRSQDITLLDDFHAMNKVRWKALYKTKKDRKEEMEFDVIYFLQLINGIKIFAYITGDEQGALRERGLISG